MARIGSFTCSGSRLLVECLFLFCFLMAADVCADDLSVTQSKQQISVVSGEKPIIQYNIQSPAVPTGIDAAYRRSGFLHPVRSPLGRIVTDTFPADHPHQHGIFFAWVKTKYDGTPVDFWNIAQASGRVLHKRVVSTFEGSDAAGFEVELVHRREKTTDSAAVDVLSEHWRVTVHVTDGAFHSFDIESHQRALTDKPLVIEKYHYGGMALRGPTRWLTAGDSFAKTNPSLTREESSFLNDKRSDRKKGNHEHAKWVALTGLTDGKPVTISVLCHANNFRASQAARLHPSKPYFCFAPCVDGEFVIDRDHPLVSKYRYLVTDKQPDPTWLDAQWDIWCGGR